MGMYLGSLPHSWLDPKLGQDSAAAHCLSVHSPGHKRTVWKTRVPVAKELTTLNSSHSSLAIQTQRKMLSWDTLAQPGHSALLCNARLWASTEHYLFRA